MTFQIYNNENAKELPIIVFCTKNGKTERAKHIGKRGTFPTLAAAQAAVHNITRFGTEKV